VGKQATNRLVRMWARTQRRFVWFGDLWPFLLLIMILGCPIVLGRFIVRSEELRVLYSRMGVLCGVLTCVSILLDQSLIPLSES
jgi:hypothetical protein